MIAAALAVDLSANVEDVTYQPTGTRGNVFLVELPPTPDVAILIKGTGGDPQLSASAVDYPNVQITVRGDIRDVIGTYDLERSIYDRLNCLDNVTLDEGGDHETWLIGATALQSNPIDLGLDDADRPRLTRNYRLRVRALTANRS